MNKRKSKAITGATGLFVCLFAFALYWPQLAGNSQPAMSTAAIPAIHIHDSVAILEAQARQADSASMAIASQILPQAERLVRMSKRPAVKHIRTYAQVPEVLARIGGELYEVTPTFYKGILIIDLDSLQQGIVREEVPEDMPVLIDTIVEHADQQITAWQKVKRFLTKPFLK